MQGLADNIAAARQYLPPEQVQAIIYHHPCPDGALGAFAAMQRFGAKDIEYIPYLRANHKDGLPAYDEKLLHGKNVLFIDCAPSLSELYNLQQICGRVMVLDHHISAANELSNQQGCFFVMQNSGAAIAWHYFMGIDEKLPLLYELVQDRDLMLWQQKELSLPLDKAIAIYNPNFEPSFFSRYIYEVNLQELVNKAKNILEQETNEINRLVSIAESKTYTCHTTNKTYKVKCVELLDYAFTLQVSEILRAHEDVDFCLTWYHEGNNIYRVSMRTAKDKDAVDLSVISKSFGGDNQISGGGHANKAGCRVVGSPALYLQDKIVEAPVVEQQARKAVRFK